MDTFDIQNQLFDIFSTDTELLNLLDNPSTNDELNDRLRREEYDPTQITPSIIPFISFVFIDAQPTRNYFLNRGLLELLIYTNSQYEAQLIYKRINKLFKANFEDFAIVAEGQKNAMIPNIYSYCMRYKLFVFS